MRRLPGILSTLIVVATVVACGSHGTTTAAGGTAATARRDPSIMDSTEIRGGNYSTVFDAVSARHADWLLPRGGPQAGRPAPLGIWIEGQSRQPRGVDYLRTLRPVDIRQVRRLSTTESLHSYSWPWGGLVLTLR